MASSSPEKHPSPSSGAADPKLQQMTINDGAPDQVEQSKPNWLSAWIRNQIKSFNPLFLIMAIKGSLPPIIFLAMYRSKSVSLEIGSLGYVIAIASSLSFAMQPRAKFLQNLFRNVLFTCLAAPMSILGLWCARQAKNHTQPPGSKALYNSSAAAVSAIFLFFNAFISNAFRARYPNLMLSVVMYSIQTNISFVIGYLLPDVLPVYYIPKRLLINFLIAFGLAFGVNILIIPVTSRTVFLRSFTEYITALSGLLKVHSDFLVTAHNLLSKEHEKPLMKAKEIFRGAFIKLAADKSDAKREIGYGVLSTNHISELFKLSRKIVWPVLGMGTMAEIIGEVMRGGNMETASAKDMIGLDDVQRAIKVLERPCQELNVLCREGLEHILCTLGLGRYAKPSPFARLFKKSQPPPTDDETAQDIGTDAFVARFDAGLDKFKDLRTNDLAQFYDAKQVKPTQGLFLVLSVEFLLFAVAQEIRVLISFVDNLRLNGSLSRKRLVFPKMKTFWKALKRLLYSPGAEDVVGKEYGGEEGDVYTKNFTGRTKQTAIHPATNNRILKFIFVVLLSIADFFRSEYSQFGLRAACATLAGTIPGFLASSYSFFTEYRGIWITITVILGMSPTTGASISGLIARSLGTIVGGLLAMGVWYMVVGRVAGVIVFSLVVMAFHYYFFLQDIRRIRTILSSFTTFLLIIGYALEVSRIGLASIESTGQQYFPVYELAPFRILVTLIGVLLAFFFTIVPFPVTSKDILRQDVARQFHLLSNMYSLTHARMSVLIHSDGTKDSQVLRKFMGKAGFKCITVQARCMENLLYSSWEPSLSYRFPKEAYGQLLSSMQNLFELFVIQNDAVSRMTGHWLHAMSESFGTEFVQSQSHLTLSVLNILSGSLSLDTPLPPFLTTPRGVSLRLLVQERMPEELSLGHVGESGYAVFSALAVSSRLVSREVEQCVELVRSLVGEVDLRWDADKGKKDM